MMIQDAVQLFGAVSVGSGMDGPSYFTGRRLNPLPGAPSPNTLNRDGKKVSRSAFSTGTKASPMPEVTRFMNSHSCWSDLCSPEYDDCGCLRATPARVPTDSAHP